MKKKRQHLNCTKILFWRPKSYVSVQKRITKALHLVVRGSNEILKDHVTLVTQFKAQVVQNGLCI